MMKSIASRMAGKCLVFLATCLITGTVWAQRSQMGPAMNPSQMSNQEILMMWQQAQKGGRSQSDAVQQLIRSGLSPMEVNNFKKRLVQAQGASTTKSPNRIADSTAFLNDSSWVQSVPQMRRSSPYYGFDFFSNPDINFDASLNINPPKTYVLGPGDELTISLTGLNETTVSDKITREGNFQIPYAGIVNLSGLTLEQAEQKIKAKMKTAYPALATGRTQLYITIDNARNINVYVIGEAARPGKYTVSALSGFFNVLYLSQGPSQQGSLRKIELIRNNKTVETIDFYTFLQKGYFSKELRLENQDVIRFPVYSKRVILNGEVKRPAIYELLEKETLADLIDYAGGFEGDAYTETAKVVQVGGNEKKVRDINISDFPNFIPKNADSVHIGAILSTYLNRVVISGAVKRPGTYEITDGLTLSKLISNADGLREDAFTSLGYIKRRRSDNAEREMISFNFKDIKTGAASDIKINKDDSVIVQSRDSVADIPSVTVAGNVRMPGIFEYRNGMSVEDLILMAGGFTIDAANHKVEISRLEKNRADTLANRLSNTIIVDVDSNLSNIRNKTPLEPLDYVFIPRLLNYRILGNVQIGGEVLNPGTYTLERRDETVQQLIGRSGGITPYASIANTQVFRNGTRVGTTVFADYKNAPKLLLLPGDSIFIPRNTSLVEVKGAVFNPQMLEYDGDRFLSYISQSGGTTDKGNLKKAYVQYSNGINKKIGHFLFFRNYPKVLPGSKIIVPEKTDAEKKGISILEITAITGMLSAIISMIAVLK